MIAFSRSGSLAPSIVAVRLVAAVKAMETNTIVNTVQQTPSIAVEQIRLKIEGPRGSIRPPDGFAG